MNRRYRHIQLDLLCVRTVTLIFILDAFMKAHQIQPVTNLELSVVERNNQFISLSDII